MGPTFQSVFGSSLWIQAFSTSTIKLYVSSIYSVQNLNSIKLLFTNQNFNSKMFLGEECESNVNVNLWSDYISLR